MQLQTLDSVSPTQVGERGGVRGNFRAQGESPPDTIAQIGQAPRSAPARTAPQRCKVLPAIRVQMMKPEIVAVSPDSLSVRRTRPTEPWRHPPCRAVQHIASTAESTRRQGVVGSNAHVVRSTSCVDALRPQRYPADIQVVASNGTSSPTPCGEQRDGRPTATIGAPNHRERDPKTVAITATSLTPVTRRGS